MPTATCVIVLTVVTGCHPEQTPSPAEAVAILTQSVPPYVYVGRGDGPKAFILRYDGPYDQPQSPIQPLAPPWSSAWYGGPYGYHGHRGESYGYASSGYRHIAPAGDRGAPPPARHVTPPTPNVVGAIGPAGTGVRRPGGVPIHRRSSSPGSSPRDRPRGNEQ